MREYIHSDGAVTSMLNGLFEINDRGDGYAEITLVGDFGEITAADVAAWAAWDAHVGRPCLPAPLGLKITRKVIGRVHGDEGRVQAAQDDETGEWTRTESAFPGYAQLIDVGTGLTAHSSAPRVRVNSLQELKQYLEANRARALQHLPTADRPGATSSPANSNGAAA